MEGLHHHIQFFRGTVHRSDWSAGPLTGFGQGGLIPRIRGGHHQGIHGIEERHEIQAALDALRQASFQIAQSRIAWRYGTRRCREHR